MTSVLLCAVLGIITTKFDLGWFNSDLKFNLKGAILNGVGCIIICLLF